MRAVEELKAGGHEGALPDPDMVAQRIEATMYKHFGESSLLPPAFLPRHIPEECPHTGLLELPLPDLHIFKLLHNVHALLMPYCSCEIMAQTHATTAS